MATNATVCPSSSDAWGKCGKVQSFLGKHGAVSDIQKTWVFVVVVVVVVVVVAVAVVVVVVVVGVVVVVYFRFGGMCCHLEHLNALLSKPRILNTTIQGLDLFIFLWRVGDPMIQQGYIFGCFPFQQQWWVKQYLVITCVSKASYKVYS